MNSRLRESCEGDGERSEPVERARIHVNARWTKPSRPPGTSVAKLGFSGVQIRRRANPTWRPVEGRSDLRRLYMKRRRMSPPALQGLGLTACPNSRLGHIEARRNVAPVLLLVWRFDP